VDKIKVLEIAHHRNGISGEGFHVVRFKWDGNASMVATVFEGAGRVAVLDAQKAADGDIAFASNSWRGDRAEPALRAAIAEWEKAREVHPLDARIAELDRMQASCNPDRLFDVLKRMDEMGRNVPGAR
jgi:hypothetical protein